MPRCTINGVEIEVKEGTTIIQAMMAHQQRIAHYCWHPGLSVAGVCRLCMVEIEGNPRLQIACNTVITEGMKINNTSEKVKEAVKWGLDFHLINHPLDCPICDQAGECGLQEQYMEFGKYDPEMAEPKQKKRKVVDLGPRVVLDSERCILCSRCVRFTDEVSKSYELGIFNRGDRSEIGTHAGKTLDNKYSLNTVDICPVGALTSRDFRFRQRVWYLKDQNTICNGCSTGCHIKVYFNKEGFFRVKPVYNAEVNGYWMCDEGRDIYRFANKENRWQQGWYRVDGNIVELKPAELAQKIQSLVTSQSAFVVTGQFTCEELDRAIGMFVKKVGASNVFHWQNEPERWNDFDGILLRGDRNPNTRGLLEVFQKLQINTHWDQLIQKLQQGMIETLIVAAPEGVTWYPDFKEKLSIFSKAKNLIWLQSVKRKEVEELPHKSLYVIPLKSYVEKNGTFINYAGLRQSFKAVTTVLHETLTLDQALGLMLGSWEGLIPVTQNASGVTANAMTLVETERPKDRVLNETRKRNEFIFQRGRL
ncbi:MAG: 2Fe-2S iron-sulfur cluster-binding protein [Bdellovibrionaceae bacterium]|nr:2Fe-2S iron-sulfur cluster-binding protein [Pseudobdellovibrionaceae bacterium]MDW8189631.1 2Fe-2S iron-sulfur cluster-binding protein [Pseudobdellovibrionaceae bacterium]